MLAAYVWLKHAWRVPAVTRAPSAAIAWVAGIPKRRRRRKLKVLDRDWEKWQGLFHD